MVTEAATNFTAYQFFNEKQNIAMRLQYILNEYFSRELYAFVDGFQINEDELPQAFYNSVSFLIVLALVTGHCLIECF